MNLFQNLSSIRSQNADFRLHDRLSYTSGNDLDWVQTRSRSLRLLPEAMFNAPVLLFATSHGFFTLYFLVCQIPAWTSTLRYKNWDDF